MSCFFVCVLIIMLHFYFQFVIVIIYSMYLYLEYEIKDNNNTIFEQKEDLFVPSNYFRHESKAGYNIRGGGI